MIYVIYVILTFRLQISKLNSQYWVAYKLLVKHTIVVMAFYKQLGSFTEVNLGARIKLYYHRKDLEDWKELNFLQKDLEGLMELDFLQKDLEGLMELDCLQIDLIYHQNE